MEETESAVQPAPPRRVGGYELLDRIAAGGMGVVYRARDPVLERDIALKVLQLDRANHPAARARMRREARAQASLSHPNIGTIYQAGDDGGLIWIAMELLPGPTLAAFVGKRNPPADVVRWGKEIASALAFAHAQ